MTRFELDKIVSKMSSSFERVHFWVEKNRGDKTRWKELLDTWYYVLGKCSVSSVEKAIDELLLREKQPRNADGYPRALREIAMQLDKEDALRTPVRYEKGERVYRCPECRDSGIITVYVSGSALEISKRFYGEERSKSITEAVACSSCENPRAKFMKSFNKNMTKAEEGL